MFKCSWRVTRRRSLGDRQSRPFHSIVMYGATIDGGLRREMKHALADWTDPDESGLDWYAFPSVYCPLAVLTRDTR